MIGFSSIINASLVEDLRKALRAGLVGPRKICNGFDGGEKTQGRFGPQAEVEVFCPDAPTLLYAATSFVMLRVMVYHVTGLCQAYCGPETTCLHDVY